VLRVYPLLMKTKAAVLYSLNQPLVIEEIEISDIGKQGTKKVRLVAKTNAGEKITLIRPEDYPFET